MQRRKFIHLVGGGVVLAAGGGAAAWQLRSDLPAAAVEAWDGPGHETDPRRRALAYAITAPNSHNLQPWRVDLREPDVITVLMDPRRLLPETDPFGRQILVSHGAFLELLVIALAQQDLQAEVQLWPAGELPSELQRWDARPVARLRLRRGATPDPLFAQILRRRTPKTGFDTTRRVEAATLQSLLSAATWPGVEAGGMLEAGRVAALRTLCRESAQVEVQTPATALESVRYTRIGPAEILAHRDGISINGPVPRVAAALGLFDRAAAPVPGSAGFKQMIEHFELAAGSAMGFVWLATPGNRRSQQVEAGRAYVRQQLKAAERGVGMHPMSQALQEFAGMRPHYEAAHRLLLGRPAPSGEGEPTLQMFCRIGYTPDAVPATPRKPLASLVMA